MDEEKKETKYTHEETVNWSKMRKATRKILQDTKKKPGHNGDVFKVNFQTKEWIKTSGLETDFLEQGKIVK